LFGDFTSRRQIHAGRYDPDRRIVKWNSRIASDYKADAMVEIGKEGVTGGERPEILVVERAVFAEPLKD